MNVVVNVAALNVVDSPHFTFREFSVLGDIQHSTFLGTLYMFEWWVGHSTFNIHEVRETFSIQHSTITYFSQEKVMLLGPFSVSLWGDFLF